MMLQFTNGMGQGDKGAHAAAIVTDVSVVDNLGDQLTVSGWRVKAILGRDVAAQLLLNWSPSTIARNLVVAEGDDPLLWGCLVARSMSVAILEVFVGVEGVGRSARADRGAAPGAPLSPGHRRPWPSSGSGPRR
jgi:hypothetical protein